MSRYGGEVTAAIGIAGIPHKECFCNEFVLSSEVGTQSLQLNEGGKKAKKLRDIKIINL